MKVKPLGDRILIKVSAAEEKTASGLVIPPTAQEKTNQGSVVSVGEDEVIKVKSGDKVIYDKYAGTQMKIDGEDYLLLNYGDVLAVIN
ncbi:MAG TPA: co-chaperone GroES [Spirochaetia bacterium]|nr:MAG: co-chaperone GroES [Spirochaetes bacterium GWB1_36_13]HCL57531.1 co-chaperone GroES [Spirochaetia bacterium]